MQAKNRLLADEGQIFVRILLVAVVTTAVLFIRRPDQFLHPYIWNEDGKFNLSAFIEHDWWSVFYPVRGYLILVPKLIINSAYNLSVFHAPAVASFLNLIFTILVIEAIVFCPTALRFRWLCAAYVLLIPTDPEEFGVSLYTLWWSGLLLVLTLVWERSEQKLGLRLLFVALGGLSSPVIFPVAALLGLRAATMKMRADRIIAAAAVGVVAVQAWAMLGGFRLSQPEVWKLPLGKIVGKYLGYFVAPGLQQEPVIIIVGLLIAPVLVLLVVWHRTRLPQQFWLLLGALVGITLITVMRAPLDIIHPVTAGPRYFFFQFIILAWLLFLVAANAGRAVSVPIVCVLAFSIVQALPNMRHFHEALDWPTELRNCAASDSYQLPIHYDGSWQKLTHVMLAGNQCQQLIGKSLF